MMGMLVRQTFADIMQIAAEEISLDHDCFDTVSVWAEMAEAYGEIWMLNMTKQVNKLLIY